MSEREKSAGFLEKAAYVLDIPAEAISGVFHIEITGNHEMLIENHRGILEYTDNEIKVNTAQCILRIVGTKLSISSMNASALKLEGNMNSIEFSML